MQSHSLMSDILSKPWSFEVYRKFVWFIEDTQVLFATKDILPYYKRYFDFSYIISNSLLLNGYEYTCETDVNTDKYYAYCRETFAKDVHFFKKFAQQEEAIVSDINKYIEKLTTTNTEKLSAKELYDLITEFYSYYVISFIPAWLRPDSLLEEMVDEIVKDQLQLSVHEIEQVKEFLLTAHSLDSLYFSSERLELLYIAKDIKHSSAQLSNLPPLICKKFQAYVDKYSWLKDPEGKSCVEFSKQEFESQLEILLEKNIDEEIARIKETRDTIELHVTDFMKKYNLNIRQKAIIHAARDFIFLRTYTTEALQRIFFWGKKILFPSIAAHLHISTEDVAMLTIKELQEFLMNTPDNINEIIKERELGFAVTIIDGQIEKRFGQEAIEFTELIRKKLHTESQSLNLSDTPCIKGLPASKGTVHGIARVITDHQEISHLKQGEILVTTMTTPEYVVAMERATAFVTDEGGITCHAAIVAREWKIPCIVGTQNATSVIKSGDYIEVDANTGTVQILTKNNE